jgi:hypothetical protein
VYVQIRKPDGALSSVLVYVNSAPSNNGNNTWVTALSAGGLNGLTSYATVGTGDQIIVWAGRANAGAINGWGIATATYLTFNGGTDVIPSLKPALSITAAPAPAFTWTTTDHTRAGSVRIYLAAAGQTNYTSYTFLYKYQIRGSAGATTWTDATGWITGTAGAVVNVLPYAAATGGTVYGRVNYRVIDTSAGNADLVNTFTPTLSLTVGTQIPATPGVLAYIDSTRPTKYTTFPDIASRAPSSANGFTLTGLDTALRYTVRIKERNLDPLHTAVSAQYPATDGSLWVPIAGYGGWYDGDIVRFDVCATNKYGFTSGFSNPQDIATLQWSAPGLPGSLVFTGSSPDMRVNELCEGQQSRISASFPAGTQALPHTAVSYLRLTVEGNAGVKPSILMPPFLYTDILWTASYIGASRSFTISVCAVTEYTRRNSEDTRYLSSPLLYLAGMLGQQPDNSTVPVSDGPWVFYTPPVQGHTPSAAGFYRINGVSVKDTTDINLTDISRYDVFKLQ